MNRKYIHLSLVDLFYGTRARLSVWIMKTLWTHTQRAVRRTEDAYNDYKWAVEPFRPTDKQES